MTSRYCSPQRLGETNEEFDEREIRARDQWRQTFVGDYHTRKEARLPSPYSDSDMDDEIMGAEVQFVEQCMQIDAGFATIEDFIKPTRYTPLPPGPHGKSLSELDPEERECMGLPPISEADKKLRAELVARDAEEAAAGHKRKRPEELPLIMNDTIQFMPRDTYAEAAAGHTRKRLPEEPSEELPLAKKTRTIRVDTIQSVPRDTRARSCELPPPPSPHGKSLSELDPEERECIGLPPISEADKKLRAELVARDAEAAAGNERKRLPEELPLIRNDTIQFMSRDTYAAGYKWKRLPEDPSAKLPLAKKTRTTRKDTIRTPKAFNITSIEQPPTAVKKALSNSKRKRASEDGFHESAPGKRARTISRSKRKTTPGGESRG
ncbi:hypothetical protein HDV63DRAFT_150762 [Trichoderma sp. SZMC 28014]